MSTACSVHGTNVVIQYSLERSITYQRIHRNLLLCNIRGPTVTKIFKIDLVGNIQKKAVQLITQNDNEGYRDRS